MVVFVCAGLVWFYAGVNVLRFDMVLAGVFMCSLLRLGMVLYAGVHVFRFGMVLRRCSLAQVWYGSTLVVAALTFHNNFFFQNRQLFCNKT